MSAKSYGLLVSSGNGPGECRQVVAHVLECIIAEAEQAFVGVDIVERTARDGPSSAVVMLSGEGAEALRDAWLGVILWRCQSTLRPKHRRKNWFVQVFALPNGEAAVQIDPESVQIQAIVAGGPGGQHQNKTASAIRARWQAPSGQAYAVVVRDHRSQHQNRRIALQRLQALVDADCAEARGAQKSNAHQMHHDLQRGAPRRVFTGPGFRPVG